MAGIKFDITADNSHFINSLDQTRNAVRSTIKEIEKQGLTTEQFFNNLQKTASAIAAGFSAKAFVNQMVQVRGEFQQLEVAFKTMLGNAEKADALMQQLTKTAAITPFDLQGVTTAAKQLLAYGIEAERVNDTLIHLGDIAAGLSLPLKDLVYLYGTTMAQGRMFTQDLRQFQGRGIPIAEELAKVLGTTKDKIGEMVTAGKVGAKEFNQAIMAMSSEGGKFAGLMEAQSKTITGQISNIEDSINVMFNDMGKQSEGIINGTLDIVSSLVENYQKVGDVIGGVVATYGTYKAAVMTVTALQGLQAAGIGTLTVAETAHYGWIVLCEKAQKLLNATLLANPYILVATAVAGLVAVMITMKSEQERVNEAYGGYVQKKSDIIKKEEEHKARIEELARVAGDESLSTDTRRLALVELEQKYPAIFAKYDTEADKLRHIRDLKAEIAAFDGKSSITMASNELDRVERRIMELEAIHTDSFINSAGGRTYTGRNRNDKEEAELKALQRRRSELANQIRKDKGSTYLSNLTGVSNADLKKQIAERRNLIAQLDVSGKKYGKVNKGGVTGVYTKDELQGQLQILQAELNRRKKVLEDSTRDFVAEANKEYRKEQDALRKLESLTDPKKRAESKQKIDGKRVSEMSGDEFLSAVQKQQKAVDEAKRKLDAFKVKGDDKASADAANRRQKQFDLEQKDTERLAAQKRALAEALEDAEIAETINDVEREIKERETQHKRKIQQIKDQADEWKKEAYKAAEERFNATNTDKFKTFADTAEGKAGWQGQTLTAEQTATIEARMREENAEYQRYTVERIKAEAQSMREYLKEYGTYEQQRLAIAQEYAEKIREAELSGNQGDVLRLRAEQRKAEGEAKASELARGIDFSQLLDGVGRIVKPLAEETYKRIQEYKKEDEYKTSSAETKKAIAELEAKLVEKGGAGSASPFSAKTWDDITKAAQRYDSALKALDWQTEVHRAAVQKQEEAQKNYNKVMNDGNSTLGERLAAEERLNNANKEVAESAEGKKNAQTNVDNTGQEVKNASTKAAKGLEDFNTILGQITGGSLKGFVDGVSNIIGMLTKKTGDEMEGLVGVIGEKAGGIIGAILTIIDALGDNPTQFVEQILDKVADVLEAVISQLPQIIMKVVEGAGNIVAGIGKGILGLFGDFFGADNHEEMLKLQDKYNRQIESSTYALNKFTEELEKSYGVMAIRNAEGAEEMIKQNMDAIVKGIDSVLSDNYGGGHSDYYHLNKSQDILSRILEFGSQYGVTAFNGSGLAWQELIGLNSSEALAKTFKDIRDSDKDLWRIITTEMGYNEGALQDWIEKLIDAYDQIDENQKALMERLTTTTEENVFDDFLDSLYNLAEGSEEVMDDIAENWQKMVNKMVVNNLVGTNFQEQLQVWYKKLADTMEKRSKDKDSKELQAELDGLKSEYEEYVAQAQAQIEQLREMGIIQSSETARVQEQSASVQAMERITTDQAEELIGRMNAGQILWQQGNDQRDLILQNLSTMQEVVSGGGRSLGEMVTLMQTANSHLQSIYENNKKIYFEFSEKIDRIARGIERL